MDAVNYDEPVTLLLGDEMDRYLSLAEAVQRVMSCEDARLRDKAGIIVRNGSAIMNLAEIEAIHRRPDFPGSATADGT